MRSRKASRGDLSMYGRSPQTKHFAFFSLEASMVDVEMSAAPLVDVAPLAAGAAAAVVGGGAAVAAVAPLAAAVAAVAAVAVVGGGDAAAAVALLAAACREVSRLDVRAAGTCFDFCLELAMATVLGLGVGDAAAAPARFRGFMGAAESETGTASRVRL